MSAAWNRFTQVALRKESVDRNVGCVDFRPLGGGVALRKESVDRNNAPAYRAGAKASRSPQGERG